MQARVCAHTGPEEDACARTGCWGQQLQAPGHPTRHPQEGVSEPWWACSALLHWNPSFQSAAQGPLHSDSTALSRISRVTHPMALRTPLPAFVNVPKGTHGTAGSPSSLTAPRTLRPSLPCLRDSSGAQPHPHARGEVPDGTEPPPSH